MTPERGVAFRSERLSEDAPVQPFAVSLARWLPVFMSDHCSDGGGGKANNFFVAFFFCLFSFLFSMFSLPLHTRMVSHKCFIIRRGKKNEAIVEASNMVD
jgi:hypothetical protein